MEQTMKLNTTIWILILSVFLISACSSDGDEKDDALTNAAANAANGLNDASTKGLKNGTGIKGAQLNGGYGAGGGNLSQDFNDPNSPQTKVIYFTIDSSQVQPDYVPIVASHAQYLVANPGLRIVLEGNTDERGSREYNIALGEQRAKSVANMMRAQGVSDSQLKIVSYGEEKPAAEGNDESAWEQNRRVEIVYQGH
jgi:peptidoglycan-associated lipoprotein